MKGVSLPFFFSPPGSGRGVAKWFICSVGLALLTTLPPGKDLLAQVPERRFEEKPRLPLQSSPRFEGPQPFDMLHYKLDLTQPMVNDALFGKMTMTMRLKTAVDSVVLNGVGLGLDTVKVDGVSKNVAFNIPAETFTINLNGRRNTGDTLRIEIAYRRIQDYPPRPGSRRGYWHFLDTLPGLPSNLGYTMSEPSDARFWMPCYDEPWEKATSEMNITVPSGYVAASNGRLLGTINNGNGTVTWRWREDNQIATYLICITTSRFTVSSLPYTKSSGETIPLQYYAWSGDSAVAAAYLPTVHTMVRAYAGYFGEYPFDKYGMTSIVPFGYGGMEHQTLTTMNRYYATTSYVVAHELAHQWWGDLVSPGSWRDIWLNESFATYGEALWKEAQGGFPALKQYMVDTLQRFYFASWQGAVYDPVGQGFGLFDQVVYSKGGWVLHTLRGVVGDSVFFRSLRAYRQKYAGKSAVTTEFKAVVDSVAGQDMGWFFNQYIFGAGWPEYASGYSWGNDTLNLTIYQRQPGSWPTFKMPMRVRAHFGANATDFTVWDSLRTQTFKVYLGPIPRPDSVVLDPDAWMLKRIVAPPNSVTDNAGKPLQFRLEQNYPNPFNPSTSIRFQIQGSTFVTLKVYDLLGREVATPVNEWKNPGEYRVQFDARNLASGVYYYRLIAGGLSRARTMLLLR